MGVKCMQKSKAIMICIILIAIVLMFVIKINTDNKPVSYGKAIDTVYNHDLEGMSLEIFKTSDLRGSEIETIWIGTGTKVNDFRTSEDEDVLILTNELISNIQDMRIVDEGRTEMLDANSESYYLLQANYDYPDLFEGDIHSLFLFVDDQMDYIYIPKEYCTLEDFFVKYSGAVAMIKIEYNDDVTELLNKILK